MRFCIHRDVLLDGLLKTVPVAEKKSTLPILSHLLLNVADSTLSITATDLEVGIQATYECDIVEPGSLTVPSRKFLEIVRELSPISVTVELQESGRVRVFAGESAFELAGMDPDDYPVWSALEHVQRTSVPAAKLANMIEKTLFAASTDDSRYNFNSVLFDQVDDKTVMVATDGHRLAKIEDEVGLHLDTRVLVPKKSLTDVKRVLDDVKDEVSLGFEPKNMVVSAKNVTMTVRLVDGDYPDYNKVIPTIAEMIVKADRGRLIQTIKRVAVLTSERNKGIFVTFSPGKLEMTATHPDLGTAKDSVEVEYDGNEFEVIFNAGYFLESLGAIDSDAVVLEYRSTGGPLIVFPEPRANYFNLVMPMRK
ncbi:MAG: DNA polymerase III subunit beta [Desulfomonile sp.]|nr:DNA polymerase III subunit beta [Desulfomonile sp.]